MVRRTIHTLPCSQLPTNRQCVQGLFHIHQETVQYTNTKELASADFSISQCSRENFAVASEMEKSGEEEEQEDIFSYREEKEATV